MWCDMLFRVGKAAEINNVFNTCLPGRGCKVARTFEFAFGVAASEGHIMDQVIGGMHTLQRRRES
jgi:hypothetical protein